MDSVSKGETSVSPFLFHFFIPRFPNILRYEHLSYFENLCQRGRFFDESHQEKWTFNRIVVLPSAGLIWDKARDFAGVKILFQNHIESIPPDVTFYPDKLDQGV